MEKESSEDYLSPITSIKHEIGSTSQSHQYYHHHQQAPESPSKAQARHRLGSLLGQIRKGDSHRDDVNEHRPEHTGDINDQELGGRPFVGRPPKKMRREKRVVFELRGKPFGLRDSGQPESIYALCRKWMYGKDDDPEPDESIEESSDFEIPHFKSLDLMATREIRVLPLPRSDIPLMDPRPQRVLCSSHVGADKINNEKELLADYTKHWKNVKKNWMKYNQKRQQRYSDSLQLIRTVYGIAQQTQI